jgi:hypothetical protein
MSLLLCVGLKYLIGIQEFFLCLPGWIFSGIIYLVASKMLQKPGTAEEVAG